MTMTMRSFALASLVMLPAAILAADECRLYLAQSSTSAPNGPVWGLYAGVDMEANTQLATPEVAIQAHDWIPNVMKQDEDEDMDNEKKTLQRKTADNLEKNTWVPDTSGALYEYRKKKRTNSAIPGAAVLAAYDDKLTNIAFNQSSAYFRPSMGETPGKNHPGRGASSHFYNVALTTTTTIPAGTEIFMDYGKNFGDDDDDEEDDATELTTKDHKKLDEVVDSMIEFMDKYKDELDDKAKQDIYNFLVQDVMKAAAGVKKAKLIQDLLPKRPEDLRAVKDSGGSLYYATPSMKKDLAWLKEQGFCMDNLVVGASTIPNAGRGAFARRDISEGTTIAPIPLVQMPDKTVIDMHEIVTEDDRAYRKDDKVIDQHLLLNYCFGHPESTMIFFPTGALVPLVNHSPGDKANSKLVWSKHSGHHAQWFEMKPEELVEPDFQFIGLVMELVATKPIKEGEEVLLDYGKEWQEVWDKHVKEWEAKVASGEIAKEWPHRALDLNEEHQTKPVKTESEAEKDPYPENVTTACFLAVNKGDSAEGTMEDPKSWAKPKDSGSEDIYLCVLNDRVEVEEGTTSMPYNYTVTAGNEKKVTVKNVPHEAIFFLDKPGTSDQFTPNSFRHPIGIPDEIFPKGPWRNLVTAEE